MILIRDNLYWVGIYNGFTTKQQPCRQHTPQFFVLNFFLFKKDMCIGNSLYATFLKLFLKIIKTIYISFVTFMCLKTPFTSSWPYNLLGILVHAAGWAPIFVVVDLAFKTMLWIKLSTKLKIIWNIIFFILCFKKKSRCRIITFAPSLQPANIKNNSRNIILF